MSLFLEKHSDHKEDPFPVILSRQLVDAGVVIGNIRLDLFHCQFVLFMRQPPSICNAAVKEYLQGTFCISDSNVGSNSSTCSLAPDIVIFF